MQHSPLVSVIIPVYNCDRYLGKAIESVLKQTYQPLETIVIDDGSTDNSAEVARNFGASVQYHYQTQSGAATARNLGVEFVRGSFLAFLDADDFWVEDKLTRQIAIFASNPDLDIVFGHVQNFHSPELDETVKNKIHCPSELMPGYHPGTMLVKREVFERVGFFETHLKMGEFISWYSRATDLGVRVQMLPELLMWRRLHETNQGIRNRESRIDYVRLAKAALDRRRAQS